MKRARQVSDRKPAAPTVLCSSVTDGLPLEVALRSMLSQTEAKLAIAAPAEKTRLQERAEVLREWIKPKSTVPVST